MARSPSVTQNDITRAAIRLLRSGENPSAAKVRVELGDRGSLTTINNGLRAWRETLGEKDLDVLPASMPNELAAPVEDFFNKCMALAEASLAAHKKECDDELERGKAEIAMAMEKQDEAERYSASLDTKLDAAMVRISNLSDQLDEMRQLRAQAVIEVENEKNLAKQLMEKNERDAIAAETAVHSLKSEFERERNEFIREKDALLQRVEFAEQKAQVEADRAERQLDYWMLEVDRERKINKKQEEAHQAKIKRLNEEAFLLNKKNEGLAHRNSKMEVDLSECAIKIDNFEKDLEHAIIEMKRLRAALKIKERLHSEVLDKNAELVETITLLRDEADKGEQKNDD